MTYVGQVNTMQIIQVRLAKNRPLGIYRKQMIMD